MDRLYRDHGVKRENYHMRKFSGKPLQVIKKNDAFIFRDAKAPLKKIKWQEVSDDKIDRLCDEVLQLLFASYKFFCAILSDNPTDNDVTTAIEKKTTLMNLICTSNILKGNITVKGHLIEDNTIPRMMWCKEHGVTSSPNYRTVFQIKSPDWKRH